MVRVKSKIEQNQTINKELHELIKKNIEHWKQVMVKRDKLWSE
jgi:formiminotetrahydrofolate cyclodeaminase